MGDIDITPNYEFRGIMDPPLLYHILEVHDNNMTRVKNRIGRVHDWKYSPPPREERIQQPLPQTRVQIHTQDPKALVTIHT